CQFKKNKKNKTTSNKKMKVSHHTNGRFCFGKLFFHFEEKTAGKGQKSAFFAQILRKEPRSPCARAPSS
ncbi:MAG: hypothetical protein OXI02_07830, partial [Candidatus Dadabacteria bacterium]|nr:hypothetical protein [Candidatus Dadabacteria bacterium]